MTFVAKIQAKMNALPTLPEFEFDSADTTNVGLKWQKWVLRFENFTVAYDINADPRKKALLLHFAGPIVHDIYETLSPDTIGDNYADTLKVLNDYFLPKKNVEFAIYKFRQTKQEVNESLDTYYTKLKQLAKYCEFDNIEKEIKSQIIQSCLSNKVRRKALRDSDVTLQQILDFARAMDATDSHMTEIEKPHTSTDRLDAVRKHSNYKQNASEKKVFSQQKKVFSQPKQHTSGKSCYRCGGEYPHSQQCPALKQECNFCKKTGHFEKVCLRKRDRKQVRLLDTCPKMDAANTSDSDNGDYVFVCHDKLRAKKRPTSRVKMLNSHVTVLVDSGVSCNVMDKHTFDKLHTKPQLKRATTKLCPYRATQPLKLYGKFDTLVESSKCYTNAMFYVADGDGTLLSYETAIDLKILNEVNSVEEIHDIIDNNLRDIYHGIGTYKGGEVKLHMGIFFHFTTPQSTQLYK